MSDAVGRLVIQPMTEPLGPRPILTGAGTIGSTVDSPNPAVSCQDRGYSQSARFVTLTRQAWYDMSY